MGLYNMDCMQCAVCHVQCAVQCVVCVQHAVCSVSYLSPQVSLTVTGCVLCGIIAFTSTVALPTFVFFSRNGAENYPGVDQDT